METQTLTEDAPSASEENGTLNEEGQSSIPVELSGDMVSTTEFRSAPVEEPKNPDQPQTDEDKAKAEADAKDAEDAKAKEAADKTPFHEHPRFKQLIQERDELRSKIAEIEQKVSAKSTNNEGNPTVIQQLAGMKDDEIRDLFDENPKLFLSNVIRAAVDESTNQVQQHLKMTEDQKRTQSYQKGVQNTFDTFGAKHEDFWPMWDSGDIKAYMDENPGHNAISAYHALTADKSAEAMQAKIDAAVKEAVEKKEQEMLANIKAKRNAITLGGGPSRGQAGGPPAELQDTKKHGGLTATLADRLRAMRSA